MVRLSEVVAAAVLAEHWPDVATSWHKPHEVCCPTAVGMFIQWQQNTCEITSGLLCSSWAVVLRPFLGRSETSVSNAVTHVRLRMLEPHQIIDAIRRSICRISLHMHLGGGAGAFQKPAMRSDASG